MICKHSLGKEADNTAAHAFVSSHLDAGNSIFFMVLHNVYFNEYRDHRTLQVA